MQWKMGRPAVVFGHGYHTKLGRCAEMARTFLKVCVVGVVDSFRNNICLFEGKEDFGIGHFVTT